MRDTDIGTDVREPYDEEQANTPEDDAVSGNLFRAHSRARRDRPARVHGLGSRACRSSVGRRTVALRCDPERSHAACLLSTSWPRLVNPPKAPSLPFTAIRTRNRNEQRRLHLQRLLQAHPRRSRLHKTPSAGFWGLTLGSIGVVYGDIGTSPLYALRESVHSGRRASEIRRAKLSFSASCRSMIWALLIVVTAKYVLILLRADNNGEGGTLALMALACAGWVRGLHSSSCSVSSAARCFTAMR